MSVDMVVAKYLDHGSYGVRSFSSVLVSLLLLVVLLLLSCAHDYSSSSSGE